MHPFNNCIQLCLIHMVRKDTIELFSLAKLQYQNHSIGFRFSLSLCKISDCLKDNLGDLVTICRAVETHDTTQLKITRNLT